MSYRNIFRFIKKCLSLKSIRFLAITAVFSLMFKPLELHVQLPDRSAALYQIQNVAVIVLARANLAMLVLLETRTAWRVS